MARCDVCQRALNPRGKRVTGLCYPCRMEGASFARLWMTDLRAQGANDAEIAHITGTSSDAVRSRIREAALR